MNSFLGVPLKGSQINIWQIQCLCNQYYTVLLGPTGISGPGSKIWKPICSSNFSDKSENIVLSYFHRFPEVPSDTDKSLCLTLVKLALKNTPILCVGSQGCSGGRLLYWICSKLLRIFRRTGCRIFHPLYVEDPGLFENLTFKSVAFFGINTPQGYWIISCPGIVIPGLSFGA